VDHLFDRAVGFAVSGFDFGERRGGFGGAMLEEALGEGATHALMEEDKRRATRVPLSVRR
jgi:hypothetical protein